MQFAWAAWVNSYPVTDGQLHLPAPVQLPVLLAVSFTYFSSTILYFWQVQYFLVVDEQLFTSTVFKPIHLQVLPLQVPSVVPLDFFTVLRPYCE